MILLRIHLQEKDELQLILTGSPSPINVDTTMIEDKTQRTSMFTHATLRHFTAKSNEIQPIGAYSGFQYSLQPKTSKDKSLLPFNFTILSR